jgi:predicted Zn finger-like uncharacterized protein
MIVICEECGKKYNIDPNKIKGERARFKCRACNHVITVTKADSVVPPPPRPPEAPTEVPRGVLPTPTGAVEPPADEEAPARAGRGIGLFGLRGKMIALFLLVPIVLIAASGALYVWQLDTLSRLLTGESSKVVQKMAEDIIAESARAVAKECLLYIQGHPNLGKKQFNNHPQFKKVAIQKVGLTGYTALYELPDANGVWRTWAHPNAKIIGIDMSKLRKPLGRNFPGFWKVYTGVKAGKESRGYYTWQDKDGRFRDKFMVCTPVEGTRFVIASTTYLDEFTKPMKKLEDRAGDMAVQTRNIVIGILGGTIILIGIIVSLYGHAVTGKLKKLTGAADRISVGELDTELDITSKDEIGELADAVSRMQESIRLSIERLRRRR